MNEAAGTADQGVSREQGGRTRKPRGHVEGSERQQGGKEALSSRVAPSGWAGAC